MTPPMPQAPQPAGKISLARELAAIDEAWRPRVIGELNGQEVKLAKFEGEFVWHRHAGEDELFLVLSGRIEIRLRDRTIELEEGEFFIVPRGVEHQPAASSPAYVLLFEPASTHRTGDPPSPSAQA